MSLASVPPSPGPRSVVPPRRTTVSLTFDAAIEASKRRDVDDFDYTPIVRVGNRQPSENELLDGLTKLAVGSNIRFDFIVNDLCRWTKIGNRS